MTSPRPAPVARRGAGAARALGPAFVAAVAYIDPGNFATNIESGSRYGYTLLWVVIGAGLAAMPVQYLSAKLGIVTGRSLPEACRERFGPGPNRVLWVQAEVMAMATDLAEFMGAAIALDLLFGMPPTLAVGVTAAVSFAVLGFQSRRGRRFELMIATMLLLLLVGFGYLILHSGLDTSAAVSGLVPSAPDERATLLALGIVGATVMPHAIYLHSALVRHPAPGRRAGPLGRALRGARKDVLLALGLAGAINACMLLIAAGAFHDTGREEISALSQAHASLTESAGALAALVFALALLAAGLSSSGIGTLAGQVVMEGFVGLRLPLFVRRGLTMLPAVVLATAGWNPTEALILSQVVLSFGVAPALIPLVRITSDRRVMGAHVNGAWALAGYVLLAGGIVALNGYLVWQQL